MADFQADSAKGPPRFANEAERECAKVLDFYGVRWEYEPRAFVLEQDDEGRTTEAFRPDFYLPEQDLYLEITVMKQRALGLDSQLETIFDLMNAGGASMTYRLMDEKDIERIMRWPFTIAIAKMRQAVLRPASGMPVSRCA